MSAAANLKTPKVLVLGYGNPGRMDDGLGPAAAARIERLGWSGVAVNDPYQLSLEDSIDIAAHDIVRFIDASKTGSTPFEERRLAAAEHMDFQSHHMDPESLLAIASHYLDSAPEAWLIGVRGYEFDFCEGLSTRAEDNLEQAVAFLTWRIGERIGVLQ